MEIFILKSLEHTWSSKHSCLCFSSLNGNASGWRRNVVSTPGVRVSLQSSPQSSSHPRAASPSGTDAPRDNLGLPVQALQVLPGSSEEPQCLSDNSNPLQLAGGLATPPWSGCRHLVISRESCPRNPNPWVFLQFISSQINRKENVCWVKE